MEKYYEKIKEYHEQDNTTNGNHGPRCENNLQHYLNPVSPPSLKAFEKLRKLANKSTNFKYNENLSLKNLLPIKD